MILDKDYEYYKLHECSTCGNKCNEDTAEANDELNKKYSDTISSGELSAKSKHPVEIIGSKIGQHPNEVIHESNNPGVPKQHDVTVPYVNGVKI